MARRAAAATSGIDFYPLITVLVLIYAVVGGALVILSALVGHIDPALRLSFKGYVDAMSLPLIALGIAKGANSLSRGISSR